MTESSENQILLNEMKSIRKTLDNHGSKLEALADAFSKMAVQNEQIVYLQTQTSALWKKMDEMTGQHGVITQIRDHQRGCPKEEMRRGFTLVWKAFGGGVTVMLLLAGWMFLLLRG